MNKQSKLTAAPMPMTGGTNAVDPVHPLSGSAATYSRCPDCDGPFSYRIRDEDTGCSYPVDDGEHYCDACDAIWSDEFLAVGSLADGWSRVEL